MTSALLLSPGAVPPERPPWRALAAVAAVVVAVHLALLGWVSGAMPRPSTAAAETFITRTIVVTPPAPPVVEMPKPPPPKPVVTAPKPKPPPRPRPAPAAPEPVAAPAAEPQPATTVEAPAAAAEPESTATAAGSGDAGPTQAPAPDPAASAPPVASAATDPPATAKLPGSVRLKFSATGQLGSAPMNLFGELEWKQDGQTYDARLSMGALFVTLRSQHSQGTIGPGGIEPTRFSDSRKAEVASHFVRDKGQVVFSNNTPPAALMSGAQDRLSVMLQLGALMAGDPARYTTDGAIAIQTVGTRDADLWIFKIGEEEQLHLPAGDFVARKLTRNARKPYDDTVELWLAPALGYLPVRFKLTQANGDFADMRLREQLPAGGAN
jgi:outer membrane biosynthesis protein TonB